MSTIIGGHYQRTLMTRQSSEAGRLPRIPFPPFFRPEVAILCPGAVPNLS